MKKFKYDTQCKTSFATYRHAWVGDLVNSTAINEEYFNPSLAIDPSHQSFDFYGSMTDITSAYLRAYYK